MKKSTSALLLCSLLLGCSVIHDDEFTQDRGCDLELKVRGFSPHVVDVTQVFLTRANLDGTQRRNEAVAVFDPLGTPNLDLRMPGSVRPRTNANLGLPSIDFFADFDDMEGFSAGDHTWTLDDACTTGPEEFPHNTDFTPIREPVVSGAAVSVTFCDLPLALRRSAVEVRVTRVLPDETNDMEVVNQAVGFYRLDDASRRPDGITIPPVANLDFDLIVEVIADLNGNGMLERTELAWSYEHDGEAHVPCDMVPILDDSGCPSVPMVPARMPACVEGGNLRIIVASAFTRNEQSTLQSDVPWFRSVTP